MSNMKSSLLGAEPPRTLGRLIVNSAPTAYEAPPLSRLGLLLAGVIFILCLVVSIDVRAASYYVNGACAANGNGTAATCAGAGGGAGAWNSMSAINAGTAGDVINIRGGLYSNQTDYYNFPPGLNGAPGNPLIVQNYAGEDVVIDGS